MHSGSVGNVLKDAVFQLSPQNCRYLREHDPILSWTALRDACGAKLAFHYPYRESMGVKEELLSMMSLVADNKKTETTLPQLPKTDYQGWE